MTPPIRILSSMAIRHALAELLAGFNALGGTQVVAESAGGVDVMKRVQQGEHCDIVILASDSIDKLMAEGRVVAAGRVDLVASNIGVAFRTGTARPCLDTPDAFAAALRAAARIGYSTGPSGVHLKRVVASLGLADTVLARLVQAPPGVPVAAMLTEGQCDLAVQQVSELVNVAGVELAGEFPAPLQAVTIFSAGITEHARDRATVDRLLAYLNAQDSAAVKRRHGLAPVSDRADAAR